MDMTGEAEIAAPRERVFEALNDPEVLKRALPGCEAIEKVSDTEMTATMVAKVGPVKAKFSGRVALSDLNPPESYTISGEGKGGAAGFAKGSAKVRLEPNGPGTLMRYEVNAQVGGKLAQLGGRLIDGTAKKMADEFFATFGEIVAGEAGEEAAEVAAGPAAPAAPAAAPEAVKTRWTLWLAAALVAAAIVIALIALS
jgi:carbon monoxide dehydrogenase subunit G